MNTVNMARLSRCEIFLTSPLDGKTLDNPLRPECYLRSRYVLLPMSAGRTPFLIGGSDGSRTRALLMYRPAVEATERASRKPPTRRVRVRIGKGKLLCRDFRSVLERLSGAIHSNS